MNLPANPGVGDPVSAADAAKLLRYARSNLPLASDTVRISRYAAGTIVEAKRGVPPPEFTPFEFQIRRWKRPAGQDAQPEDWRTFEVVAGTVAGVKPFGTNAGCT